VPLTVVGVSHETAPVEVREQLAYGEQDVVSAVHALRREGGVEEAVLISTCNRTEAYLFPARDEGAFHAVERLFSARSPRLEEDLAEYMFEKRGAEAVRHLFRVTAGLDAMVTGESEIQGQIREAYRQAAGLETTPPLVGPVLNRLFQTALAVGGEVRSETSIGEGTASVASVAVELAGKIFGSLRGKRVLILGAGITGQLIMQALVREGVRGVSVANRTYDRAVRLARKHRGQAVPFEGIADVLATVDIVLSSTAAPHPVLTRAILRESFREPRRHPLLIIDIAIPRDVDPAVGDEAEVFLYNVDDLRTIVDEHVKLRDKALPEAERIIDAHCEEFAAWYASLEVVPVIQSMRDKAEAHREHELERLFGGLGHLSPEDRDRVVEFSRRLQNKLLHEPTTRLRKGLADRGGPGLVEAVRFLYGIEDGLNLPIESEGGDPLPEPGSEESPEP
jgi:glutamyl-tRNA reductase